MDNLISTCFVIMRLDGLVYPTIYLTEPSGGPDVYVRKFDDPFSAKNFIREVNTDSVEIEVTREAV